MPKHKFKVRLRDIRRFYEILDELKARLGRKRTLCTAHGRMNWPERGVYFFFEPGEERSTSGTGPRVVRVGTHALKFGVRKTLWGRLREHRGNLRGACADGGDHRASVFRRHVGTALMGRYPDRWSQEVQDSWGVGSSAKKAIRGRECPLEQAVSRHIRCMLFLCVGVNDPPGPESKRGLIERNAVALLSNYHFQSAPIDPPSPDWLGRWAASEKIRCSGLWNVNHVAEDYDPGFLTALEAFLAKT